MVGPTRSSNGGPPRRGGAWASLAAGALALAALPAAVVATRWSRTYELLDAAVGIPVAMLLGALAVSLARRALSGSRVSLGSSKRERIARVGRALGLAGFLLGVTGAMAIGVYAVLSNVAD